MIECASTGAYFKLDLIDKSDSEWTNDIYESYYWHTADEPLKILKELAFVGGISTEMMYVTEHAFV